MAHFRTLIVLGRLAETIPRPAYKQLDRHIQQRRYERTRPSTPPPRYNPPPAPRYTPPPPPPRQTDYRKR